MIDNAKRGSVIDSAYGYKDAVDKYYITQLSKDSDFEFDDGTYLVSELKGLGLTVSGNEPTDDSWVVIKDNGVYDFSLKFEDYVVNYDVDNKIPIAIKDGTIEITPEEAQAEQDRIDNVKTIVTAYIDEALTKNSSLESEIAKLVSDMTDVVIENGPVDGWIHFDVTDDGVVIKDYSLKVDDYVADYSEDITVTKDGNLRDMPVVPVIARTIDGIIYYDTEWIGTNPVYYNPTTDTSCTDYNESNSNTGNTVGCLKWYAYSEQTENNEKKVNLLLDHNTTATLAWNTSNSNTAGPSYASDQLLGKLQSDTSGWARIPNRTDSYSMKVARKSIDYTINYSSYKARIITAQEVANIVGNTSWDETSTSSTTFYFDGLGTSASSTCKSGDTTGCSYRWLYDRTSKTCKRYGCINESDVPTYGYWTVSSFVSNPGYAWYVYEYGSMYSHNVNSGSINGLRPVITVSKSDIFES